MLFSTGWRFLYLSLNACLAYVLKWCVIAMSLCVPPLSLTEWKKWNVTCQTSVSIKQSNRCFKTQMESQLVSVSISKTCFYQGFNFCPILARYACGEVMPFLPKVTSEQFCMLGVGTNSKNGMNWNGHEHSGHWRRHEDSRVAVEVTLTSVYWPTQLRETHCFQHPRASFLCTFHSAHSTALLSSILID